MITNCVPLWQSGGVLGPPRARGQPSSTERHRVASSPERFAGHSERHRQRRHTDDAVRSTVRCFNLGM